MQNSVPPGYRLLPIRTADDAAHWRAPVAAAYTRIFSEAPYFEEFTLEEAGRIWDRLTRIPGHVTLIVVTDAGELAAFASAVPLSARPDVARELTGLVPLRHTWYLAELGVVPEHRSQGFARLLIRERLRHMEKLATHAVMRVSESDNRSKQMYLDLGFEDMGVYMEVPGPRVDGGVRADRRLFLHRVLSQVDFG